MGDAGGCNELMVDLGANTEIVMGSKDKIIACAVDGGAYRGDTAAAMADSLCLPEDVRSVLVLFDGHRDELLGFGLKRTPGGFVPSGFHRVLSRDTLSELDGFESLVSLEKDAPRIREIAGDKAAKLQTVPHVQASFLITNCPDDFSAPLTDPVYLRPAVFVEPRIPRTL